MAYMCPYSDAVPINVTVYQKAWGVTDAWVMCEDFRNREETFLPSPLSFFCRRGFSMIYDNLRITTGKHS